MTIAEVAGIIKKIAEGFEDACIRCLADNKSVVYDAVHEQLYSGQDGDGNYLSPTYTEDDYFRNRKRPWMHYDDETGKTYIGAEGYREWKHDITPPVAGAMLGLPPRPVDVPNLWIDGTFYRSITVRRQGDSLVVNSEDGAAIVAKYGDRILNMGPVAVEYFTTTYMLPAIGSFFKECGYK